MSNAELCKSLMSQWINPVRTWSRDTIVCPSGNALERQTLYKKQVLANVNGNATGNVISGHISKKLQYAQFATAPPRRGKSYANNSNPNINNLPIINNAIVIDCSGNK
jgi:hypothetical protein